MKLNYENKFVVVTGATGALGSALCHEFDAHKAKLIICGRSKEKLKTLAGKLNRCIYKEVDLSFPEQIQKFIEDAASENGGIDVLVNCAATAVPKKFEDMTEPEIDKEIKVNFLAPIQLIRFVLPLMKEKRTGTIINISSVCAYTPYPYLASYSATKAALSALTTALQIELRSTNIKIISVYVDKLSEGLRFPPPKDSLHAYLFGDKIKGGTKPSVIAKKIVEQSMNGKDTIFNGGKIGYYLTPLLLPFLKWVLYSTKVKAVFNSTFPYRW